MRAHPISTSGPQSAVPFGSYLLLKRLAVGGMAELFLAKDTRTERMVVLKRILPYLAEEAEFVRMFLDEARIAASLHHPNIVELYELGHLDGSTFIAMEWVDGVDLRRLLQKEQEKGEVMPPGVAAWFVARLCEGLHHAHMAKDASGAPLGIIHRDVSPQNVMISFRGDVKLVDFGIAKATAWMSRSKPGVIKGKFLYLAPEQLTTEPLDHRMDLFAVGTLLYELTTGQSPFYRTSTEAVIYAIRMEDPDPPVAIRKGYPATLSRIILKCLAKERSRRYQSADELRAALEDFIHAEAPTTRDDAAEYVSRLFGDDSERTSLYIPPNAQSKKAAPRAESRTDTSTQRDDSPFANLDDERTVPLSSPRVAARLVPEGRRETGEIDAPPTGPTKNDRPAARARPAPANPWEPETTAPMPKTPPLVAAPRRDFVGTLELDEDVPQTAVSTSGARNVRVGEVFPPLVPTMLGESLVEITPAAPQPAALIPSSRPPIRPAPRPGPPIPSSDSIPEVSADSIVSAGNVTLGSLDPIEDPEPSEPSEPSPPPPSTRAPPRRGPPQPIRRPAPRDPDDLIDTVDQAQEFSVSGRRSSSQKVFALIFGGAALVVALLLAVLLWPSTPEPKEAPKRRATPTEPAPRSELVRVQVRAPKGATLTIDGQALEPDATIERAAGELVVKFVCPPKKKGRGQPGTLRAQIPQSTGLVAVEVPCN
ncbi:MAG: serine/threonine protein kinase [Myxococcota bacterium]